MTRPPISEFIAFLPASHWDATRQFYEQTLGLPCVLEQVDCCIYQVAGTGYLGFCRRAEAPQPAERVILTLVYGRRRRMARAPAGARRRNHEAAHCQRAVPDLPPVRPRPERLPDRIQRFDDPRWGG